MASAPCSWAVSHPCPRHARRRPGAPRALGHPRRPRHRRLRRRGPARRGKRGGSPATSARCATNSSTPYARPSRTRSSAATRERRLPANAHFSFPGCEGDSLLLLLDAQGIECSTGSACTAGVAQPSHVLLATGTDPDLARGTLRFSLGHTSTRADVEAVAAAIGPAVERARSAGLS